MNIKKVLLAFLLVFTIFTANVAVNVSYTKGISYITEVSAKGSSGGFKSGGFSGSKGSSGGFKSGNVSPAKPSKPSAPSTGGSTAPNVGSNTNRGGWGGGGFSFFPIFMPWGFGGGGGGMFFNPFGFVMNIILIVVVIGVVVWVIRRFKNK